MPARFPSRYISIILDIFFIYLHFVTLHAMLCYRHVDGCLLLFIASRARFAMSAQRQRAEMRALLPR